MKDGFYDKLHVKDLKVDHINLLSNTIDFTIKGSAERIKILYESVYNTNCFTNFYKNVIDQLSDKYINGFLRLFHVHSLKKIPENSITFCTDEFDNLIVCRGTTKGIKYYKLAEYYPTTQTLINVEDESIKLSIEQIG
jgi:hypothetical protein